MSVGTFNLVVPQATTFNFQFQVKDTVTGPWNVTGYSAVMTVRPFLGSTTKTLEATILNGKIAVDGPNGIFTVTFSDLDTTIKAEAYVFDILSILEVKCDIFTGEKYRNNNFTLSGLSSGMYLLSATDGKNKILKKIIVE